MPPRAFVKPTLPKALLNQLGDGYVQGRGRNAPQGRKERRKTERQQRKVARKQPQTQPPRSRSYVTRDDSSSDEDRRPLPDISPPVPVATAKPTKSILKKTTPREARQASTSPSPPPRIPRGVKDRIAQDDAEIAALEKKLGLTKKKNKIPKSFQEDGLGDLLEGLDDNVETGGKQKRKLTEDDEWLRKKRRRIQSEAQDGSGALDSLEELEPSGEDSEDSSIFDAASDLNGDDNFDDDYPDQDAAQRFEDDFDGFDSDDETSLPVSQKAPRENPYIAPGSQPVTATSTSAGKYVPPSLRAPASDETEKVARLKRQVQGLLNRLSEANLVSILQSVEQLYQSNPRQYVTSALVDLLLAPICDRTSLMDTFIILHAGFIAACYKVIGVDFGAQIIERVVAAFDTHYKNMDDNGKEANNLIALLSQLYNFQVIGSTLVFDCVRLFLSELSETNAELLLKIMRSSGPQLRQDDPTALKDIVMLLQKAVGKAGKTSVRMSFMVETIQNLKNNRLKASSTSAVSSEHTVRMKKILGALNVRASLKATEPLRISLSDVRDSDKRGKWWLVGASWQNPAKINESSAPGAQEGNMTEASKDLGAQAIDDGEIDLLQLAREQGMNTDIRRAIFVTLVSASDYQDAHLRLLKLKLKKSQELEIPRVLLRCAGAEQTHNPYYSLIARKLCSDRKIKKAFEFSLFNLFGRMGEKRDEDDMDDDDDEREAVATREVVNLARLFGNLIADGGMSITALRNLCFAYLQPNTRIFVEVLLVTVIVQSQKQRKDRDAKALLDIIAGVQFAPQMVQGLRYFLEKTVAKADLAADRKEKETIRWGSAVAIEGLSSLSMQSVPAEELSD
ncbi:suppressor of glycerol defect [Elasticomyces elasticus]|nr:suppressor of glycerol defect [Elasticomyces elasticus]